MLFEASLALALILHTDEMSAGPPREHSAKIRRTPNTINSLDLENVKTLLVGVYLNGTSTRRPIVVHIYQNSIYIPYDWANGQGFRTENHPVQIGGQAFIPVTAFRGLKTVLSDDETTLEIECSASCFAGRSIYASNPYRPDITPVEPGSFFNYDVSVQLGEDTTSAVLGEYGTFTDWGLGKADFICRNSTSEFDCVRLETGWTIDLVNRLERLSLGDTVSQPASWGVPFRFAGIKFGTDFSIQPDFVTFPIPSFSGESALPSTADIYINGIRRFSEEVSPGPFSIIDVPVITGAGNAELIVTDLLGRETVITAPYYASPRQLKNGLSEYSIELGSIRQLYGFESSEYDDSFLGLGFRSGVNDQLTAGFRAEFSNEIASFGTEASVTSRHFGTLSGAVALSFQTLERPGLEQDHFGTLINLEHQWQSPEFSSSIRFEYAEAEYRRIGLQERVLPQYTVSAVFSRQWEHLGTTSVNYLYRDERIGIDRSFIGLSHLKPFGKLSIGFSAFHTFNPESESILELRIARAFPRGVSASVSQRSDPSTGDNTRSVLFGRSPPSQGGIGFRGRYDRADRESGNTERLLGAVELRQNTGEYRLEVSSLNNEETVRLNAKGGIVSTAGDLRLTRRVTDSFAVVEVTDQPGVLVRQDQQPQGYTDHDGKIVLSRLRSFDENVITIEPSDLSLNTSIISDVSRTITPGRRTGHKVTFETRTRRSYLVSLQHEDGTPLPRGDEITVSGRDTPLIIGSQGQVYLDGVSAPLTLTYQGKTPCSIMLSDLPASPFSEPFARLEGVTCQSGEDR